MVRRNYKSLECSPEVMFKVSPESVVLLVVFVVVSVLFVVALVL